MGKLSSGVLGLAGDSASESVDVDGEAEAGQDAGGVCMVKGLDVFRKYFADYKDQYILIGGAACDIIFESNEVNFRATRIQLICNSFG